MARARSRNISADIQSSLILPVQGSPQAWTLEPCRNQARWKRLAGMSSPLRHSRAWAESRDSQATVVPSAFAVLRLASLEHIEGDAGALVSSCPPGRQIALRLLLSVPL